MKKLLAVAVVLLAATVACSSMKVNNDYDHQADFSKYKTYAWHESSTNIADTDPLAHERFIKAIDSQLVAKGFTKASSNPDVFVTYHAEDKDQMSIDTTYMGGGWGYGRGWGWGGGGMSSASTTVRRYKVGTIVLDMWDAAEKSLVWRGTVSDTVSDNPQKNASKIQTAAQKLFKNYPPSGE